MKFHNWLRKQTNQNDPVGDFARDVKADAESPKNNSIKKWRTYLSNVGACDGAINAFERAWIEYKLREEQADKERIGSEYFAN
ncbi:MAG: hypothetical protein FJ130_04180 [Deltaproteobacteria bacterium]|nr:hypothetical protein [Deltaproteobacteria bacterium]